MKRTDKFYMVDRGAVTRVKAEILRELPAKPDGMTMEDVNALARLLAYGRQSGDYSCYENAVDFLWMAMRIDRGPQLRLLALAIGNDAAKEVGK